MPMIFHDYIQEGTVTHCFRMACMEKEGKPSRFGPFLLLSRRRLKSISQNVVIGS